MSSSDRPTVLIVEDEPDVAETYQFWLEDDYEILLAEDGEEALSLLDVDVDVVLLDRMMPGLSGDEVLEHIRDADLDCRVSMVTAVDPDYDILEMGFDAYLSKPIKQPELRDTVENLLERAEYDALLQEYYSLVEKQATLQSSKTETELEASKEYQQLREEIESLEDDLAVTLGGIEDDEDFIAAVRELEDVEEI